MMNHRNIGLKNPHKVKDDDYDDARRDEKKNYTRDECGETSGGLLLKLTQFFCCLAQLSA